jgi:hypothetical protein
VITSQGTSLTLTLADGGGTINLGKLLDVDMAFNSPLREIKPLRDDALDESGRYLSIYEQTTCDHTMNVSALTTGFSVTSVGKKGSLSAVGVGWSITFPVAIMENMKVVAKVGDYLRVSYTFRRSFS